MEIGRLDYLRKKVSKKKFKFESKMTPKILSLEDIGSVVPSRVTTEGRLYFLKDESCRQTSPHLSRV